ncbi:MAG: magnesium-protoporphyrin IX monomethyl ester (oxidative) cyclase, partial [Pseudomonadota bacterium]
FELTTEISRQVFPIELDIHNPKFYDKLEKLRQLADRMEESKAKKGVFARLGRMSLAARCGMQFIGLYFMRTRKNRPPVRVRLEPVW